MPSSIPYDPSLVLGNIVEPQKIFHLQRIAELQKPIETARDNLNALKQQKLSLEMTMREMVNMKIAQKELEPLRKSINDVEKKMVEAAIEFSQRMMENQEKIKDLKNAAPDDTISASIESPIDYGKTAIKTLPLSNDSIKMDAQYFRFEAQKDSSDSFASSIASYVSTQVGINNNPVVTYDASKDISSAANLAVNNITSTHDIQGTLVITANCTHKNANLIYPFILNVDKAVNAWNAYNPGDTINMDDLSSVMEIFSNSKNATNAKMQLLSGATYGSSFVGMVHFRKEHDTESAQKTISTASKISTKMTVGKFFNKKSGKFGVDKKMAASIRDMLSTSTVTSHCTVICMGVIPSIKAHDVQTAVKMLETDPTKTMEQLGQVQAATDSQMQTVSSEAQEAEEQQNASEVQNNFLTSAVGALTEKEAESNKVIDTNSMMTAFEDYLTRAAEGDCGVPINYYLKPITKLQIAKAWVNKYYPEQFTRISSGDDSESVKSDDSGENEE